jgi:hypothetical protein
MLKYREIFRFTTMIESGGLPLGELESTQNFVPPFPEQAGYGSGKFATSDNILDCRHKKREKGKHDDAGPLVERTPKRTPGIREIDDIGSEYETDLEPTGFQLPNLPRWLREKFTRNRQ